MKFRCLHVFCVSLMSFCLVSLLYNLSTVGDVNFRWSRLRKYQFLQEVTTMWMNTTTAAATTTTPDTGARNLSDKIRILCWILTCPKSHKTKAQAVKDTWGKRCNKLIFISTQPDDNLGVISLNLQEDYQSLWRKSREAFKILHDRYLNEYDWFLKADDDTYVIMENLRYMLTPYDPEDPVAFGSKYILNKVEYLTGGAGYTLSRAALRRYGTYGYANSSVCALPIPSSEEDVLMTRCLINMGVMLGDTRDGKGSGRQFHFAARDVISGELPPWHYERTKFGQSKGIENMSEVPISFHWMPPKVLYEMEYLLYKIHPVGLIVPQRSFPAPLPPDTKSIPKKILEAYRQSIRNITKNVTISSSSTVVKTEE